MNHQQKKNRDRNWAARDFNAGLISRGDLGAVLVGRAHYLHRKLIRQYYYCTSRGKHMIRDYFLTH